MEKATEILQRQWSTTQQDNETLLAQLQQIEAQLQAAQVRLTTDCVSGVFQFPNKEIYDQLRAKAREVDTLTQRAELAEINFKNLQERCEMVKAYVSKFIDKKNDRIQQLKDQRHQV